MRFLPFKTATGGMVFPTAPVQVMTVTRSRFPHKFGSTRSCFSSPTTLLWSAFYMRSGLFLVPSFFIFLTGMKCIQKFLLIYVTAANQWKTSYSPYFSSWVVLSEKFQPIKTRHFIIYCEVVYYSILLFNTEGDLSNFIRIHSKCTCR
jgi:hypothetical protein